ncbi:MAG: NUDIX hydrolase, partial [Myxococcales bacterium]
MAREPIGTWFYSLVAVRQGDRFLALREARHGQGWYLPAGRCEAGERLTEAAVRECLEETGVAVVLDGLLRIEHEVTPTGSRVRAI